MSDKIHGYSTISHKYWISIHHREITGIKNKKIWKRDEGTNDGRNCIVHDNTIKALISPRGLLAKDHYLRRKFGVTGRISAAVLWVPIARNKQRERVFLQLQACSSSECHSRRFCISASFSLWPHYFFPRNMPWYILNLMSYTFRFLSCPLNGIYLLNLIDRRMWVSYIGERGGTKITL